MSNPDYATILFVREDEHGTQCLLQHKDRGHPNPDMRDVWTVFGGQMDADETVEDCTVRRIGQKLGPVVQQAHPIEVLKRFDTVKIGQPDKEANLTLFIAPFASKISDIQLGEGIGYSFFYLDSLPENMLDHERTLIDRFAEQADTYSS